MSIPWFPRCPGCPWCPNGTHVAHGTQGAHGPECPWSRVSMVPMPEVQRSFTYCCTLVSQACFPCCLCSEKIIFIHSFIHSFIHILPCQVVLLSMVRVWLCQTSHKLSPTLHMQTLNKAWVRAGGYKQSLPRYPQGQCRTCLLPGVCCHLKSLSFNYANYHTITCSPILTPACKHWMCTCRVTQ